MIRGWSQIVGDILDAARLDPEFEHLRDVSDLELAKRISTASPLVQGEIRRAVREGSYVLPPFSPVMVYAPPYRVAYDMANDWLHIGVPGDSIRPNVSQRTSQEIADVLGFRVASTVILDAALRVALIKLDATGNKLPPGRYDGRVGTDLIRPITSSLAAMIEENQRIDALIDGRKGLIGGGVKSWVPDNRLMDLAYVAARAKQFGYPNEGKQTAVNYGFYGRHAPSAPSTPIAGWKVYQPPGFRHPWGHVDYSQRGPRLIRDEALIGGGKWGTSSSGIVHPVDLIANDPDTAALYHADGRPGPARHPWIPWCGSAPDPSSPISHEALVCEILDSTAGAPLDEPAPRVAPWLMVAGGTIGAFVAGKWKR